MTEENTLDIDDFYTERHKRLDRIALFANILAWFAIIFAILMGIGILFQEKNSIESQYLFQGTIKTFEETLKEDPFLAVRIFVKVFNSVLQGFIYAVVLKAISLALYMVVEIDLNISEKEEGKNV